MLLFQHSPGFRSILTSSPLVATLRHVDAVNSPASALAVLVLVVLTRELLPCKRPSEIPRPRTSSLIGGTCLIARPNKAPRPRIPLAPISRHTPRPTQSWIEPIAQLVRYAQPGRIWSAGSWLRRDAMLAKGVDVSRISREVYAMAREICRAI